MSDRPAVTVWANVSPCQATPGHSSPVDGLPGRSDGGAQFRVGGDEAGVITAHVMRRPSTRPVSNQAMLSWSTAWARSQIVCSYLGLQQLVDLGVAKLREAIRVVQVLIAGEPPEHELAKQPGEQVPRVLTMATFRQDATGEVGKTKRIVELPAGEQRPRRK